MTTDDLIRFERRDRAMAAGLATQPIGWNTFAQLTRFCPASALDPSGNQIFYRGLRRGFAAEAYVRAEDGKFSRLRISCGCVCRCRPPPPSSITYLPGVGRGHVAARLAALTSTGAYRLSIAIANAPPLSVTIGITLPNEPVVTVRLLLTPDAHGFLDVSSTAITHQGDWQAKIPESGNEMAAQNAAAMVLLDKLADNGFGAFIPLLDLIHRRVDVKVRSMLQGSADESTLQGPVVEAVTGRGVGCVASATTAAAFVNKYVTHFPTKLALLVLIAVGGLVCSQADPPGDYQSPDPGDAPSFNPLEPNQVPSDGDDGSPDPGSGPIAGGAGAGGAGAGSAAGDGGGAGGAERGPLPEELPEDAGA